MAWSPAATQIMRRIVRASDTDILMFNAPVERPRDRRIIKMLGARRWKPNLFMIVVTNGGDPDAAYRITCRSAHASRETRNSPVRSYERCPARSIRDGSRPYERTRHPCANSRPNHHCESESPVGYGRAPVRAWCPGCDPV